MNVKVTIQGSPKEIAELIKSISSAGDRQDAKKISEVIEEQMQTMMDKASRDLYQS